LLYKVSFLAEHGKHAQVVHHARTRLQGSIISHHFRSSIILDCASVFLLLSHFVYYKNLMYTTFSVVESIPPLTSRRRRPVSFSSPQSSPFCSVHQSSSLVLLRSSNPVHAHTLTSTFSSRTLSSGLTKSTPQPSVPTVPRILFSTYLRRPLRYSHRPSHNTHPENHSFDSLTIRSFYSCNTHTLFCSLSGATNIRLILHVFNVMQRL